MHEKNDVPQDEVRPNVPELPREPLPSEDQKYFNESLRAAVLGMGELIRERRRRH